MFNAKKAAGVALAGVLALTGTVAGFSLKSNGGASAASNFTESNYSWGTVNIGGGGFVSAIVKGKDAMYLRTDVGGAYKYNYETQKWDQLFGFLTDAERGYLSVGAIAIDPTDDNTAYFLCGCAYFTDAKTVIFKTTDGGKTFTKSDVTDMIQVHANGDGRGCSEPMAVDPDNPDIIYAGGDVTAGDSALIKSTDAGKTWKPVKTYDDLGFFKNEIKWPTWTSHIARGTGKGEYNTQNGIDVIDIVDGKVYVGTAITGEANIHVASVEDDKFTALSDDLPNNEYPLTIRHDVNGNLYFTYAGGLAFSSGSSGIKKYNPKDKTVTDISPEAKSFGAVDFAADDPNKMVVRTWALWSDEWWADEWSDNSIAWGDHFYRTTDGGKTWTDITPGYGEMDYSTSPATKKFVSNPLKDGGYPWIYGKACHWGTNMVIDPENPNKVYLTSGNGVFACKNVWDEKGVQFYFEPQGVEEVVALDFTSTADGHNYSAIGDYDGFEHFKDGSMKQYTPNIGSTSAIAVCPSDTKVMARFPSNDGKSYYSTDGGESWKEMGESKTGGKAAITKLDDGKYRIFHSSDNTCAFEYSDDFGSTWTSAANIDSAYGSKPTYFLVDPNKPNVVYAETTYYNSSWGYSKSAAELSDANYALYTSTDYGTTWTKKQICMYDQCDSAGRIAYLKGDTIVLAAGYYGAYIVTDTGKTVTKIDGLSYVKTIGYGAPKKAGDPNVLYIYGKPADSDPEGIYASEDEGKTWNLINKDHLYGGTGNGNFIVGDMGEYGTIYMSTVGCGIVKGTLKSISDNPTDPDTTNITTTNITSTTTITTDEPATTVSSRIPTTSASEIESTTSKSTSVTDITDAKGLEVPDGEKLVWGDSDTNGELTIADAIALNRALAGNMELTGQGRLNSNLYQYDKSAKIIDSMDMECEMKLLTNILSDGDLPIKTEAIISAPQS